MRSFLVFTAFLVLSGCVHHGPAAKLVPQPVLLQDAVLKTSRFTITVGKDVTNRCDLDKLKQYLEAGCSFVDEHLPLPAGVTNCIYVRVIDRINPAIRNYPPKAVILGYPCFEEGRLTIVLALSGVNADTVRHELSHLRLMELGIAPPLWLDEGLSHWCEAEGQLNKELLAVLQKEGCSQAYRWPSKTLAEAEWLDGVRKSRAAGWVVVYYLIHHRHMKPIDVIRLPEAELPTADEAWREVKKNVQAGPTTGPVSLNVDTGPCLGFFAPPNSLIVIGQVAFLTAINGGNREVWLTREEALGGAQARFVEHWI